MILEFTVKNFGSLKNETVLSLIAEPSKSKSNNIYIAKIANGEEIRLLKSAVIYGANASGKTTVLKAFQTFLRFIQGNRLEAGQDISFYEPFLFDEETVESPTSFKLSFIGPSSVRFIYEFEFNRKEILSETLDYYPNGSKTNLFKRAKSNDPKELATTGILGSTLKNQVIKVFKNKLMLSRFGTDEPNEFLSTVYIYFKKYSVINTTRSFRYENFRREISDLFYTDNLFQESLNDLIRKGDIKINNIDVKELTDEENNFPSNLPDELKKKLLEEFKYEITGVHDLYKGIEKISTRKLPFNKESRGTNVLYYLGGKILQTLQNGDVLFVDELETSLHPNLAKLLIDIFHSSEYNIKGAQLIFTTHDITLLDKSLFRKDQIWICQKDNYGVSDFYSVQDFKDVREDTPFARWYLAGKFGGLPRIIFSGSSSTESKIKNG